MRTRIVLGVFLLVCAGMFGLWYLVLDPAVHAQYQLSVPVGEVVQGRVTSAQTIDVGEMYFGDDESVAFRILNNGPHLLETTRVTASCSCSRAEILPRVIPPREESVLRVRVAAGHHARNLSEQVVVQFKNGQSLTRNVSGRVVPRYEARPSRVDVGEVWQGKSQLSRSIALAVKGRLAQYADVSAWVVRQNSEGITPRIVSTPSGMAALEVYLDPSVLEQGEIQQRLVIETGDTRQPQLVLPIDGRIHKKVLFARERLFIGAVSADDHIELRVPGRWFGAKGQISEVRSANGDMAIAWRVEDRAENKFELVVNVDFISTDRLVEDLLVISVRGEEATTLLPVIAYVED